MVLILQNKKRFKPFLTKEYKESGQSKDLATTKNVGDENNIIFLYDTWLDQLIKNSISGPLPQGEDKITVSSIIKEISN